MAKILIVDDEKQIRKILAKFLAKMGFQVIEAAGGEEAIGLLKSGLDMDLMITDLKMPQVTGLDVLYEKKILNDTRPAIILTGSIDDKKFLSVAKELGVGLEDILTKPVDLFLLLDAVKKKLHMT